MSSRTRAWKAYRERFDRAVERCNSMCSCVEGTTDDREQVTFHFNPVDRYLFMAAMRLVTKPPGWDYELQDDLIRFSHREDRQ